MTLGSGLKKKLIKGRGFEINSKDKKVYDKYYIDMKKFDKNILSLKYTATGNIVPNFKSVIINNNVKKVINDIMNKKFQEYDYKSLSIIEKRLVSKLSDFMGGVEGVDNTDDEFQKNYDILVGSIYAGNDSKIIKNKLKQMILVAMDENRIPKNVGYKQIIDLNL
jgi:hypothetical protein